MHADHHPYLRFTSRARLIKAIDSLSGLIEGIDIDQKINPKELIFLNDWLQEHDNVHHQHPFNELIPIVRSSIKDHILSVEEKKDLLWLCNQIASDTSYDNYVTSDMRRLHGIMGGIAADGAISKQELNGLRDWLSDHEHLRMCWPYDEIDSIITSVLADHKITSDEHKSLLHWFSQFVEQGNDHRSFSPPVDFQGTITGVCAVNPEITIKGNVFCLTGASHRYKRADFAKHISALGGQFSDSLNKRVNYLVVGSEGNPCWKYACYGRKVETAINLRKSGSRILIIHENDFHDAASDISGI